MFHILVHVSILKNMKNILIFINNFYVTFWRKQYIFRKRLNFPPRNCPSVLTTELFVLIKVCRNCYTLIASCLLCS